MSLFKISLVISGYRQIIFGQIICLLQNFLVNRIRKSLKDLSASVLIYCKSTQQSMRHLLFTGNTMTSPLWSQGETICSQMVCHYQYSLIDSRYVPSSKWYHTETPQHPRSRHQRVFQLVMRSLSLLSQRINKLDMITNASSPIPLSVAPQPGNRLLDDMQRHGCISPIT